MSLFSTFYSGDAAIIEAAVKEGRLDFGDDSGVKTVDFSGGALQPFLFPGDFLTLTKGDPASFWTLKARSLIPGEEEGLYRVPEAECDKFLALSEAQLLAFSDQWNVRRAEERARSQRSSSIWRSVTYWKITGSLAAGLLLGYVLHPDYPAALLMLAGWLAGAFSFGAYVNRGQRLRQKRRPKKGPADWVPPLRDLQRFLADARRRGTPVYYYWSL